MPKPIKLFAYLNIEHPLVAWEVAIGRIKSACDNNIDGFGISLWQYNLLRNCATRGANQRFLNELKLERIRQEKYPEKVSRLQGLYFFKDENDARAAVKRWGVPQREKYISEVMFLPNALTYLDSEWITSYLNSKDDIWMDGYWSADKLGQTPLTEVLASGFGCVNNISLRQQAYQNIMKIWPTSTPLLASAMCAFQRAKMNEVCLVKPALIREGDRLVGNYYIKMSDFDERQEEVIDAVDFFQKRGEFPSIKLPSDPTKFFAIPDLRSQRFEFYGAELVELFGKVHEP